MIAPVVLTGEDFHVKYSQNNCSVCLPAMRFCGSFPEVLTVNMKLFWRGCRCAVSLLLHLHGLLKGRCWDGDLEQTAGSEHARPGFSALPPCS